MTTSSPPLRHSPLRHALLQQIAATARTERRWTRRRNPRKTDPASGLPDHLYTAGTPDDRPSSVLQRAVRQLDQHGLLTATPSLDNNEGVDLSPAGQHELTAWTRKFGEPGQP
ncbi:hypothetical protein ACIA5G_50970 [Amycolatopsis sp. NPDC051758]|uniref:hypothetical protein n=1 Tax=Amycolatopsis sp. NPDC051758 TaxID=3363935 RepID=UPI0037ADEBD6